jgi:hypothetical protein
MDLKSEGMRIIEECEARLRALMESAISQRRYGDISFLAEMASRISTLTGHAEATPIGGTPPPQLFNSTTTTVPVAVGEGLDNRIPKKAQDRLSSKYPKFERTDDRLIKVGWSKKDRAIYEHRASIAAVMAITRQFEASMGKDGYLRMDDTLPASLSDGTEVPSYQAYLVLAWLRYMGAIEKQGNDGYKLVRTSLDADDVEEIWQQTARRK